MFEKFFIFLIVIFIFADPLRGQILIDEKQREIDRLDEAIVEAKSRVRSTRIVRAGDLLQLLPTVSVARRAPYEDMQGAENYIGLSINTKELGDLSDRFENRETFKTKALRQIQTNGFVIRKYIERKYLLKDRLWKFTQIRKSVENPLEIASMDEKMDELRVKIQELEIAMEKTYAEIEYLCVDAGR